MSKDSIGILLQGSVNDSSEKVVKAYQENFPDAEILFSTWKTENVKNISCNVLQLEEPKPVPLSHVCVNNWAAEEFSKYISSKDISQNHINHQIKGSLDGLKKMHADIHKKNNPVVRVSMRIVMMTAMDCCWNCPLGISQIPRNVTFFF